MLAGRERIREAHEIGDGKRLAAYGRVDVRSFEGRGIAQREERIAQRLSPLAERRGHDPSEQRDVVDPGFRRAERHEARDCRIDIGYRAERARRHREKPRHPEHRLQHHGQPAVIRGGGQRGHARDHLPLQHHVDVTELGLELRQVEQQWRADVVGQVADDAQRRTQWREIEFERVSHVQGQLPGRKLGRKPLREVAVDLDRGEMPGTPDERPRQRGEPGSDLDQLVAGLRRDGIDDPRDVMRIGQEVLPEAAPWLVLFHRV